MTETAKQAAPSHTSPRVAVVVPIYNRIDITRAFLDSFRRVDYPNYEIIIVDDASPDGSAAIIRKEYPEVRVIEGGGDLWWTKATNIGVRDALARGALYILTVNDDVELHPGFLRALVTYAEAHPRTLVGAYIYEQGNRTSLWYAGGKIAWLSGQFLHRMSDDEGPVMWLTGMGTLVPAETFNAIGFYDETHLPQYAADTDFSMRARLAGFNLAVVPESIIWNRTEESTQKTLRKRVTLGNLLMPLFSNRSDAKLTLRTHLYRRYWPVPLIPVAFIAFYGRFMMKQLIRLLRLR